MHYFYQSAKLSYLDLAHYKIFVELSALDTESEYWTILFSNRICRLLTLLQQLGTRVKIQITLGYKVCLGWFSH